MLSVEIEELACRVLQSSSNFTRKISNKQKSVFFLRLAYELVNLIKFDGLETWNFPPLKFLTSDRNLLFLSFLMFAQEFTNVDNTVG